MRIIDLTQAFHNSMWTFPRPWFPKVAITQMGFFEKVGRNTHSITIGSHHGTHVDAPYHQVADGVTIDQVSLDILVGPAKMIDLSADLATTDVVTKAMLESKMNGKWSERMLFNLGWAKHWDSDVYFQHPPYFSEEAAQSLLDHGVRLIGMDTASPDTHAPGAAKDSPVHRMLLGNGVIIVENLGNLNALGDEVFTFFAAPINIRGCDGSPARCLALFDENTPTTMSGRSLQ